MDVACSLYIHPRLSSRHHQKRARPCAPLPRVRTPSGSVAPPRAPQRPAACARAQAQQPCSSRKLSSTASRCAGMRSAPPLPARRRRAKGAMTQELRQRRGQRYRHASGEGRRKESTSSWLWIWNRAGGAPRGRCARVGDAAAASSEALSVLWHAPRSAAPARGMTRLGRTSLCKWGQGAFKIAQFRAPPFCGAAAPFGYVRCAGKVISPISSPPRARAWQSSRQRSRSVALRSDAQRHFRVCSPRPSPPPLCARGFDAMRMPWDLRREN